MKKYGPVVWLALFSFVAALVCAIFDLNLACGVLIGSIVALASYGLTAREFARATREGKGVRARLLLYAPAKFAVVLAGFILASRLSTSAVAGLFLGVLTALAGYVTAGLVGKD